MEFYYDSVDGDVLIIVADGGLNADTAEQFDQEVGKLVEAGLTRIIIDCGKLDYLSSSGIGMLIRVHGRMKSRGGDVKICSVKGLVSQVLQLSRLDRVFELYPDVNRARLAFRPKSTEPR